MKSEGVYPTRFTYTLLIQAFARAKRVDLMQTVHLVRTSSQKTTCSELYMQDARDQGVTLPMSVFADMLLAYAVNGNTAAV